MQGKENMKMQEMIRTICIYKKEGCCEIRSLRCFYITNLESERQTMNSCELCNDKCLVDSFGVSDS
jgi:hypothetical protein